ncbi:2-hydroxyacid dehydrogenase [Gallaecimonas mangrovi]|uniref:2-hydroxyacid dehydrogenase n=1 Tax=Gallaecimonas mangrovi TaxID=2291597 RepID=UPI000E204D90|nr:glyoxylate/hydroxypyruvate reductase A [Gallaecimonas mangrovi]
MSLALIAPGRDGKAFADCLHQLQPGLDIQVWPHLSSPDTVEFAVCWQPPADAFKPLTKLKVVQSLGAGVDGLAPLLPPGVTLCRTVSEHLKRDIRDYVLLAILANQRQWQTLAQQQRHQQWQQTPYRRTGTVGVLGLGELGRFVAEQLAQWGFSVKGWSRTPKVISGISCFAGIKTLGDFAGELDYVVCLLPLTEQTQGLLNRDLFQKLKKAAYLIHAGRGAQLIEADLLEALANGQLSGACLDVFNQEPLPRQHPFWRHPQITITPHTASITSSQDLAAAVYQNYLAMHHGKALNHVVDQTQGY